MSEKFLDLTVNLNPKLKDPKTQIYDLEQLIKHVFEQETFDEQNKYYCETCKDFSELTTKTPKLTKMPECLIVTLNRFYFNLNQNQRSKILDPVTTPSQLDFSKILSNESQSNRESDVYYLYAMIIHSVFSFDPY